MVVRFGEDYRPHSRLIVKRRVSRGAVVWKERYPGLGEVEVSRRGLSVSAEGCCNLDFAQPNRISAHLLVTRNHDYHVNRPTIGYQNVAGARM